MLKKNGICYKICNSSTIELSSEHYIEPIIKDFSIVELRIRNETIKLRQCYKFPLGDRILPYEVNYISKIDNKTYLLHTEIKNKTTQYLLPLLGKVEYPTNIKKTFTKEILDDMQKYCKNTYLINAYLSGDSPERLEGYMYLKFRFSPHLVYQSLEETLSTSHPLFVSIQDFGDSYTYIKFRIPVEFRNDLQKFLQGSYTQLSLKLKEAIVDFYSLSPKSNMHRILTGGKEYREQLSKELGALIEGELDSIPDINNELIQL